MSFLTCALALGFFLLPEAGGKARALEAIEEKITVISLYPSVGTVKDWATLREQGLISIPGLRVLGVYHEKELTDYEKAQDYVKAQGLDWFTFHPISAPLSPDSLFKRNACSREFEEIFEQADGVVFFGGPDIPPRIYGEKTNLLTDVEDTYRHYLEVSLAFHLLGGSQDESFRPLLEGRPRFPAVGFCLGCQSLNVGTGGTLTQDIWSEIYGLTFFEDVIASGPDFWHSNPHARVDTGEKLAGFVFHPIRLEPGARIWQEMDFAAPGSPLILSAHHQQAEKLGLGFQVIATSPDGKIIEAIAHGRYPNVIGLQFHPEAGFLYDSESRFKFTPTQSEDVIPKAYLEGHPPSLEFHRKLWAWISRTWVESRRSRPR